MGSLSDRHRVTEVDALRDKGSRSIGALAADLDRDAGLAIITEGLLGYLDTDAVDGIWRRFARTLSGFASGRYISDLHLGSVQNAQIRAFRAALSVFVRGQVHLHFDNAQQAEGALRDAGFARAKLYRASDVPGVESVRDRGGRLAHILEASTR
jgi:O-methyltransferase involved in polyketide biosynthesis